MNFFSWMNLEDYQLTYQIEPIRGLKITLDHHWFRVAQNHDDWYYGNGKPYLIKDMLNKVRELLDQK